MFYLILSCPGFDETLFFFRFDAEGNKIETEPHNEHSAVNHTSTQIEPSDAIELNINTENKEVSHV